MTEGFYIGTIETEGFNGDGRRWKRNVQKVMRATDLVAATMKVIAMLKNPSKEFPPQNGARLVAVREAPAEFARAAEMLQDDYIP